jgi:multidrug efflux system outer membrane protein
MTRAHQLPAIVTTCSLLVLGGCASYLGNNKARQADSEVPDDWGAINEVVGTGAPTTPAAQQQWDEFFTDPHLRALIDEAIDNNQELNGRLQEIIIAQAEVGGRKGEYIPKLDAGIGGGVEKVGSDSSQGVSDEAHGVPVNLPDLAFGLSASWEVDIWGQLRKAAKSANYRYLATIEAKNFLLTQIIAEIANSYYELLALDNQIEVLDRYIAILEDGLEIVKLKKKAARATELAVQRFEAEVLKNQALRYDLEQRRVEAENRVNFLVGRFPQQVERDATNFKQTPPPAVDVGIPSELLDNRPDVREAKLLLEAAKLDVKSAKARFYPSLSIVAGVGYDSFNPAHIVSTPQSLVYNVAGNLVAPLLNRAAIKADYQSANARQMQAVLGYERTLLLAFTEVANNLANCENLRNRFERLSQQVETLEQAIETSNILYQSARADYLEVLLTRRDSLEAEMDLINTRLEQMQAIVEIYRALGGGWRTDETVADEALVTQQLEEAKARDEREKQRAKKKEERKQRRRRGR